VPDYHNERDCEHGRLRRACEICELLAEINELLAEINELREALSEIADGPDRHDPVRSIKLAKRALGHRASP
jgi:hypothetical protein